MKEIFVEVILVTLVQLENMNPYTGTQYSEQYFRILEGRKKLPVYAKKDLVINLVKENQVTVIVGETGSGKTTQIPQLLYEEFNKDNQKTSKIACTQPRRIAATSVATRVAHEMDVKLGEHVGYSVRFDQLCSESTVIKYLTDGMLLREAINDHELSAYSLIIVDEAHERTLPSDILMGLLKRICAKRPLTSKNPVRLVVMSATLDAETFSNYYSKAPMLMIPGRTFPVEIVFKDESVEDYVEASIECVIEIIKKEPAGDILVFLTGQDEIDDACTTIKRLVTNLKKSHHEMIGEIEIIPLYSSLSPHLQQKVFQPSPVSVGRRIGRKVIVATNIAETSLTIDGVVYVVDCGLSKQNVFDPRLNAESLLPAPISQASARQRSGRAGRTQAGKCFRLYTQESFEKEMNDHSHPAIITSNIASVVLLLKRLGIDDLVNFDFLTAPAPETMMRALELLFHLNALTMSLELTEKGKLMSDFPLDPPLSSSLINALATLENDSAKFRSHNEKIVFVNSVLTIVAMLSVPPCWVRPIYSTAAADKAHAAFHHALGDHLTLVNLFNEYIQVKVQQDEKNATVSTTNEKRPKVDILGEWCYQNFLNARSLYSAASVRRQLASILMQCAAQSNQQSFIQGWVIKDFVSASEPWPISNAVAIMIIKNLVSSFFLNIAKKSKNKNIYSTLVDSHEAMIHPSCCLTKQKGSADYSWILYNDHIVTTKNYLRTVTAIPDKNIFYTCAPKNWYKSLNL